MKFNLLTIFWNCACAYIPQLVNFITPLNFLCAGCTLTLLRSAGERSRSTYSLNCIATPSLAQDRHDDEGYN